MRQFQKTLEDLSSRVASAEATKTSWLPPVSVQEASEQMQYLQRLRDKMTTAGALLDDCNEQQAFFTANQVLVPAVCLSRLEDLNTRWVRKKYQTISNIKIMNIKINDENFKSYRRKNFLKLFNWVFLFNDLMACQVKKTKIWQRAFKSCCMYLKHKVFNKQLI